MNCPDCGSKLVKRNGKYGEFYGCSNYPDCTYTQNIIDEDDYEYGECPECKSPLRPIETEYGTYLECTEYPNCNYQEWTEFEYGECPNVEHYL